MQTLNQLVVEAVARTPKKALRNDQIRSYIQKRRPGTSAATVTEIIRQTAAAGEIAKIPVIGLGQSKFVYTKATGTPYHRTGVTKLVKTVLTVNKMDSREIFNSVLVLNANVTKEEVDNALYGLAKAGKIQKSKNPMTDQNTVSTQSKFLYSL